jgi:hypothetical protein
LIDADITNLLINNNNIAFYRLPRAPQEAHSTPLAGQMSNLPGDDSGKELLSLLRLWYKARLFFGTGPVWRGFVKGKT